MAPIQHGTFAIASFEEQRAHSRFVPLRSRCIGVLDDAITHIFEIGNLSNHGVAGTCAHPLQIGRYYPFVFECGETRLGEVRWAARGKLGIYFRVPLGRALLSGSARQAMVEREPRFETRRPAIVHHADTRRPATVRNVSTAGLLLETVMTLRPGDRIAVECGKLVLAGEVRWSNHVRAGVRLDEAVALERFENATYSAEALRAAAL